MTSPYGHHHLALRFMIVGPRNAVTTLAATGPGPCRRRLPHGSRERCRKQQEAGAADVLFSDGSRGRGDRVVGAGGLNSRLRTELFPGAPAPAAAPLSGGQGVWRAVLPRPPGLQRVAMWMGGAVKPGVDPVSDAQLHVVVTERRPRNARTAKGLR